MTRFCSIFNQLLQLFPRTAFQRAVAETGAEHRTQVSCWQQFVAMLFCQLGGAITVRLKADNRDSEHASGYPAQFRLPSAAPTDQRSAD